MNNMIRLDISGSKIYKNSKMHSTFSLLVGEQIEMVTYVKNTIRIFAQQESVNCILWKLGAVWNIGHMVQNQKPFFF